VNGVGCELDSQLRDCMGGIVKRSVPFLCSYLTVEKLGINTELRWVDRKHIRFNFCIDAITGPVGCIVGIRLSVVLV
jgi:hypothetical protein